MTLISFNGDPVPIGVVIKAYDSQGVLRGACVVTTAGQWGVMHVYGRGPSWLPGSVEDVTSFTINDCPARVLEHIASADGWHQVRLSAYETKYVYGRVVDEAGQGIEGVTIRLYRSAGLGWNQIREKATDLRGEFGFGISPAMSGYRLTAEDLPNYESYTATVPFELKATIVDANTIEFWLPDEPNVGEFVFVDSASTAEEAEETVTVLLTVSTSTERCPRLR